MTSHDDHPNREFFPELEPPPEGLAKLRKRIEASEQRSLSTRRRLVLAFAIALLVALAGLLWSLQNRASNNSSGAVHQEHAEAATPPTPLPYSDHPSAAQVGLAPVQDQPVEVEASFQATQAVHRIQVSNPNVILYMHASSEKRTELEGE